MIHYLLDHLINLSEKMTQRYFRTFLFIGYPTELRKWREEVPNAVR